MGAGRGKRGTDLEGSLCKKMEGCGNFSIQCI